MDIWPLYLFHQNAVTINFAVDLYTSCTLTPRHDKQIILRSVDQKLEERFASLADLEVATTYKLPLLARIVRFFKPPTGLELVSNSEAPAGAGISGSSSLLISCAAALNRLCETRHNLEQLRVIAQNVETQVIRVPAGCQDYYPAMYGGVSAIELTTGGIRHTAVDIDLKDLNARAVVAYTGKPRNSGINNWEVTKAHIDGNKKVIRNFDGIAAIAHSLREALDRADWPQLARLIREEWSHRKKNAPGISTPLIDELVKVSMKSGAQAAKVCGAGGGGCVFFLVDPPRKQNVQSALTKAGAEVLPISVAPRGVRLSIRRS